MGFRGFMAASGTSALAAAGGGSPLAPAIDDCAEAGGVHSSEQNNVVKMILMGKSTTLQFCGVGSQLLSKALAGNFVKRQKHARRIAHRVTRALSEHRTKASTWLMTQLYPGVLADRNRWLLHASYR
jgi:hypothetical protein